ncbi:hypothetical protein QR680_006886 [Steinernema hermaphroditum]|uniref:Amino acid transporter transmembrane domain-containing protein n=1 Tax=Steinernema hermaphroditum TaxID=289476 RepID=A0AA39LY49_9BILA|nr:hypothetical protein QR680_006886 [Steinernema hermaphroditum]
MNKSYKYLVWYKVSLCSDINLKLGEKVLYASGDSENRGIRREKNRNAHFVNWFIMGLFVVGDMAGGGLITLPTVAVSVARENGHTRYKVIIYQPS